MSISDQIANEFRWIQYSELCDNIVSIINTLKPQIIPPFYFESGVDVNVQLSGYSLKNDIKVFGEISTHLTHLREWYLWVAQTPYINNNQDLRDDFNELLLYKYTLIDEIISQLTNPIDLDIIKKIDESLEYNLLDYLIGDTERWNELVNLRKNGINFNTMNKDYDMMDGLPVIPLTNTDFSFTSLQFSLDEYSELPKDLGLFNSGLISGISIEYGIFKFFVNISNNFGKILKEYTLKIN